MKIKFALYAAVLCPLISYAQLDVTHYYQTNNVDNKLISRTPMRGYQAESMTYDLWPVHASGNPVVLTNENTFVVWYLSAITNADTVYWATTGTLVNTTTTQYQFRLTAPETNIKEPGRYRSTVRAFTTINGTNYYAGTLADNYYDLKASPFADQYNVISPLPGSLSIPTNLWISGAVLGSYDGTNTAWIEAMGIDIVARSGVASNDTTISGLQTQIDLFPTNNTFTLNGGPLIPDYFTVTTTPFIAYTTNSLGPVVTHLDRIESIYSTFTHKAHQILPYAPYQTNTYQLTATATNVTINNEKLQVTFTTFDPADITLTHGDYARTLTLAASNAHLYTNRYIYGGITGSLRHAMTEGWDDALTGTNNQVYTLQDHANTNYLRNTNCWAYNLMDITCASPWNSDHGQCKAGTALTPRHIIYAKHYAMPTGTVLRFVANDNTVYERTLIDYRYPANDLAIGLLDTDLPAAIQPAKVLNEYRLSEFMPSPGKPDIRLSFFGYQLPVLFFDQQERALCGEWAGKTLYNELVLISQSHTNRTAHYSFPRGGASGNPILTKCGTDTVLITCWHSAIYGPSPSYYAPEIEAAMIDMGGPYSNLNYIIYDEYTQIVTNLPPSL